MDLKLELSTHRPTCRSKESLVVTHLTRFDAFINNNYRIGVFYQDARVSNAIGKITHYMPSCVCWIHQWRCYEVICLCLSSGWSHQMYICLTIFNNILQYFLGKGSNFFFFIFLNVNDYLSYVFTKQQVYYVLTQEMENARYHNWFA